MAYVVQKKATKFVEYLPMEIPLDKANETIVLDYFKPSDYDGLYEIFKEAIDEGQTYPQDFMDHGQFERYYLSDAVFVARSTNGKVVGGFYVKPNYPGRSSHICNAGFLVHKQQRRKGIGEILFTKYLKIAKDLGYEASFFNLVYATNQGSVRLCRKLGFKEVGIVPKAGKMKDLGYVDAYQFYYDFSTFDEATV
nr:N-acetyltransferase aca1 [Parasteatoda tepidariorum]